MKQETTLEEFANKTYPFYGDVELREAIELGANWQQEQDKNKYSDEEVLDLLNKREQYLIESVGEFYQSNLEWFEKIKKK